MSDPRSQAIDIAEKVLGPLARRGVPIGERTTYRVGGSASLFVEISDDSDLPTLVDAIAASGVEVLVLGKGSNLLVADAGFPGLVVTLTDRYATVEFEEGIVVAGGATPLPILARRSAARGASGLEWAVGIPGSVGGAVRMNAGGHGAETVDRLIDAHVLRLDDAREGVLDADALALSYRHSAVRPCDLVLSARFSVAVGDKAASEAEIAGIVAWRREYQPGGRNGGSVFSNPVGDSAGRLIDAAGLKGLRIGSAEVSQKHANFIQVDEAGSADDVRRLIDLVRERVAQRQGITLDTELCLIGFVL